jgi:hypothetical protein
VNHGRVACRVTVFNPASAQWEWARSCRCDPVRGLRCVRPAVAPSMPDDDLPVSKRDPALVATPPPAASIVILMLLCVAMAARCSDVVRTGQAVTFVPTSNLHLQAWHCVPDDY